MRPVLYALVLAVPLASSVTSPIMAQQERQALEISRQDQQMNAAIAKARASPSHFWERFGMPRPGERGFALKVAISHAQGADHLWANEIERHGGKITAS